MTGQSRLHRVAFLDTNTLHYIGIYLIYAKRENLFPWIKNMANEKEVAINNVNNKAESNLKKSLKRGIETVDFLLTQNVQVQYTPISELELITTRTKGKAIISAAQEGVPDRILSRFYEEEIQELVDTTDLANIKDRVNSLSSMLEESGVAIETKHQTNESLVLAKEINGLVYVDAMDSIIYASAILAQADYLFTADKYLQNTVNHIHNPSGNPRYENIRQKLQQSVTQIILGKAEDIALPSAHTIAADGKILPPFPISKAGSSP